MTFNWNSLTDYYDNYFKINRFDRGAIIKHYFGWSKSPTKIGKKTNQTPIMTQSSQLIMSRFGQILFEKFHDYYYFYENYLKKKYSNLKSIIESVIIIHIYFIFFIFFSVHTNSKLKNIQKISGVLLKMTRLSIPVSTTHQG